MFGVRTRTFVVLVVAAIPFATGCGDDAGKGGQRPALSQSDSTNDPSLPTSKALGPPPNELSAAHILIAHKRSERAAAEITRSKEQALVRAQEVAEKAKAEGADFAELAKEYSDGPSGPRGGNLGNFRPNQMVAPFTDAVMKLAIGDVSDPVETQFGYHVILRQEVKVIPKASAKHILVMYKGSQRAPANITRTKPEAHARLEECLKRIQDGEKFEDLAKEYSDGPTSVRGGDLGEFPQGAMHPNFDEAVFACEVDKITEIIETPFGYHIIYRYK